LNRQQTGRCPACGARLRVGHRQRTGTCGRCGVVLGVRRGAAVAAARRSKTRETRGPHVGRNPARLDPEASAGRQLDWAAETFEAFHGRPPRVEKVKVTLPKAVMLLGELRSFSYAPPASSERGRTDWGQPIEWRHDGGDVGIPLLRVGKRPKCYIGPDGSLHILGGTQWMDGKKGVMG